MEKDNQNLIARLKYIESNNRISNFESTNRININNDRVFVSQDSDIQSVERTYSAGNFENNMINESIQREGNSKLKKYTRSLDSSSIQIDNNSINISNKEYSKDNSLLDDDNDNEYVSEPSIKENRLTFGKYNPKSNILSKSDGLHDAKD